MTGTSDIANYLLPPINMWYTFPANSLTGQGQFLLWNLPGMREIKYSIMIIF